MALGDQLMQQPQPLCDHFLREEIDAGRIPARVSKTSDKTEPDGIITDTENNRDCRCCSFRRSRRYVAGRRDHSHLASD
jgi:hypothetical protein